MQVGRLWYLDADPLLLPQNPSSRDCIRAGGISCDLWEVESPFDRRSLGEAIPGLWSLWQEAHHASRGNPDLESHRGQRSLFPAGHSRLEVHLHNLWVLLGAPAADPGPHAHVYLFRRSGGWSLQRVLTEVYCCTKMTSVCQRTLEVIGPLLNTTCRFDRVEDSVMTLDLNHWHAEFIGDSILFTGVWVLCTDQ